MIISLGHNLRIINSMVYVLIIRIDIELTIIVRVNFIDLNMDN